MKRIKLLTLLALSVFVLPMQTKAQSLKNLLNSSTVQNVVSAVTGGKTISVENITGTWTYSQPAVSLESDNTLKNVAGSVATSQVETKLAEYYKKAGISAGTFSFTFNSDNSFSCKLKGKTISGTYTLDADAKTVSLSFGKISAGKLNTFTAYVELSGSNLKLLFNPDKLLTLISTISSVSGNSTLSTVSSLLNSYDGMKVGFTLTK